MPLIFTLCLASKDSKKAKIIAVFPEKEHHHEKVNE